MQTSLRSASGAASTPEFTYTNGQPQDQSVARPLDPSARSEKPEEDDREQLAQVLDISPHALSRMQQRGISAQQLQDAINSPNKELQPNGNTKCTAGGVTVILSPTGKVVTCY